MVNGHGVSHRQACETAGIARSTGQYAPKLRDAANDITVNGTNGVHISGMYANGGQVNMGDHLVLSSGLITSGIDRTQSFPDDGGTIALQEWVNAQGFQKTSSNGLISLSPQSSAPSTPSSGVVFYARSTGAFSWKGTNGFQRSFVGTGMTADRDYTLPDASGTLVLNDNAATLTNKTIDAANNTITNIGTSNMSFAAYSLIANNTNATAAPTATIFKDVAEQSYSGTLTWGGTTAPSGTSNLTYQWSQMGHLVTLRINLKYSNAGTSVTSVAMTLPNDMPAPYIPTGFAGAGNNYYFGTGRLGTASDNTANSQINVMLRRNAAADTGYEIYATLTASSTPKVAYATIQYFAQ
jgi:hypothetical protein